MTMRALSKEAAGDFLCEVACFFENRPTGGEDSAHWSNAQNAENCRLIAGMLKSDGPNELVAFLAVHADRYQRDYNLNGLHPTHYDLMKKHGARMDSFNRATNAHGADGEQAPEKSDG